MGMAAEGGVAELEARWAATLCGLVLGPTGLASHPSAVTQLSEGARLPGLGRRSSDAVARTAVSLAFLRAFHEQLVKPLCSGGATTKEVVARLVKPISVGQNCLAARLPPAAVGVPTAFISHAWGTCHAVEPPACVCGPGAGSFALMVESVCDFFANALPSETFVWLDIFAVDQHDTHGSDLDGGRTLEKTVALAAHTLVVLDRGTALPLSRLWCLYEIGATPPEKLQLLTRGFAAVQLRAKFRSVNVSTATCWDTEDGFYEAFIRGQIERVHGSQTLFEQKLKLRLLLKPLSYEADLQALLANSTDDDWTFNDLREFVTGSGGEHRLACIVGGPGEGKSTIGAALCREPGLVHAWHFCKASDVGRQDKGAVIRSLAYQLATARDGCELLFPSFAEAVLSLDEEALQGLDDPSMAFEMLLRRPLAALEGRRTVLLVDGLDEAEVPGRPVSAVLNLLLSLGQIEGLPLSVIVTLRSERVIMDALQARWQMGTSCFAPDTLRAPSDQPLLLRLLNGRRADRSDHSASSFDEAYARFFDSVPAEEWAEQKRVIDVILSARQPPSLALLEEMKVHALLTRLPGWGLLFFERDYCVHLLHKSLSDWLLDASRSGGHAADKARGHTSWADVLTQQLTAWLDGSGDAPVSNSYLYHHALAHLDASGRESESRRLLLRFPWLQATLRERGVWALIQDVAVRATPDDGTLNTLKRALKLSALGLQGSDAAEVSLPTQIIGRLKPLASKSPELQLLVNDASAWRGSVGWLYPIHTSISVPAGPLEYVIPVDGPIVCLVAGPGCGIVAYTREPTNTLRCWDETTGELQHTIPFEKGREELTCLAFFSSGRIVGAGRDLTRDVSSTLQAGPPRTNQRGFVQLWNIEAEICEAKALCTAEPTCIATTAERLVVCGEGDFVSIWNVETWDCTKLYQMSLVNAVAITADGFVVSGGNDMRILVWDLETGVCMGTFPQRSRVSHLSVANNDLVLFRCHPARELERSLKRSDPPDANKTERLGILNIKSGEYKLAHWV